MNNAEMRVEAGINAAEQRIRNSIRDGRNQMIEAFEMTRTMCGRLTSTCSLAIYFLIQI